LPCRETPFWREKSKFLSFGRPPFFSLLPQAKKKKKKTRIASFRIINTKKKSVDFMKSGLGSGVPTPP